MLQGVRLEMSLVEHRGGKDGLVVGILSQSSSGSTTGIEYVGGIVRAGGLLGFSVGLGQVAGGLLGWLTSWRIGCFLGWLVRRSLVGRVGGGSRGLQLLATTVSSSSSSSERM